MTKPTTSAPMGAAKCARRTGLTVRALRVYERHGLIDPKRTTKGWRCYGPTELQRLNVIVTLKAFGMTLEQIRTLLVARTPPLAGVLQMQLRACHARRDAIEKSLELVQTALSAIGSGRPLSLQELCNLTRSMTMGTEMEKGRSIQARPRPDQREDHAGRGAGFYELDGSATVQRVEGYARSRTGPEGPELLGARSGAPKIRVKPNGPMDQGLTSSSYESDRRGFLDTVLALLEGHHPAVYDRVDRARFDLAQSQDILRGAILPTVRSTVAEFGNGRCAIALGDVHSVIDPMMGQGANMASFAAFVLGEEIVKSDALDSRLAERADLRREDRVLSASRWTNVMLQPPTQALGSLIEAMSRNRRLCDEFTENFNTPEVQWDHLASPRRIQAWIERCSGS